jgi:hypothetical protein
MSHFYMVVDEIVAIARHRFRVQVWRGANPPPLVLLPQVPGHPPPDWFSSQIANVVLRNFLGFSLPIPNFFELSRWNGQGRAFRVHFETVGYQLRPTLLNPKYEPLKPQVIEQVFGRHLDTPN